MLYCFVCSPLVLPAPTTSGRYRVAVVLRARSYTALSSYLRSFVKDSVEGASPSSLSGSYDLHGYSLGIREEVSYLNERI